LGNIIICNISKSFEVHVNMCFSGSVVLKGKKNSMTSPKFHDHHPFEIEKDLTLYLKKLKFPILKDNLYQV
jgi:hypothetical protein